MGGFIGRRGRAGALAVGGVAALVAAAAAGAPSGPRSGTNEDRGSPREARGPGAVGWRLEAVGPGESLPALLRRLGVSDPEASLLADLARPWVDPERLRPLALRTRRPGAAAPNGVELRLDRDRTLRFVLEGARWSAHLDSAPVVVDTLVVSGRVASSLYAAELRADRGLSLSEKRELPGLLAEVFAWQIDFYRDVRPGDAFRLAVERDVRPDGSVRASRPIAAEYLSRGRLLSAYRFRAEADRDEIFYDRHGTALRGAFLRSPLAYGRVTSRYARSRFHPRLRVRRAHEGVDYGAPSGTPVRATGAGTVSEAGWRGDYGLVVELRHGRGLETRYAHLSGIADGLHPGARVEQGAVLGTVGSTGSSTAPHLHYEFRIHGQATDPTAVHLPLERRLEPEERRRFASARAAADALLATRPWPVVVPARPADVEDGVR